MRHSRSLAVLADVAKFKCEESGRKEPSLNACACIGSTTSCCAHLGWALTGSIGERTVTPRLKTACWSSES
ncbi:hypothetical protein BAUCODRAFT_124670 [Baudoinia panamericana UAMH 10762]|uniref:Uncharacterized protein n=1 Tax=Baudoinia panamericana (strain UAMH 10762) TaxID=717646 RepID=M2MBN5_BAUPA|nr:uncharacterized protein BAUCODRAFT_124670 [Baudoinia panamericana UAMH 10762]EMC93921.1 hypothetical protein BAUCODRAFT_124670 [Baudoinia panamericana UAMH 10762]